MIKEYIVKKSGKDGIAIKCISARFPKVQIFIKPNFVTFVVAYAPTKEGPEGQKAKYMAALNNTAPPTFARNYIFVLTDAISRTGKSGEGGGVRETGKQTAKCWAHMAETCST